MKLLNIVILTLVISGVCAIPKSRWMKKSKRGIFGEGFGGGGLHGLSYGIPATGFGLPFGLHHKPYTPFAFTHGDASVQSFQINYPKYNYIQQKPIIAQPAPFPIAAPFTPQVQFAAAHFPQLFQGFAGVAHVQNVHHAVAPAPAHINPTISTPTHAFSPAPVLPVAASPTLFFHQKPIVPVAVPAAVVPKPVIFTKPQHPVFTFAALTPQFVSIPYPSEGPTENPSTTPNTASITPTNEQPSTQQPNPDGQSGTNFVTNVNPDQQSWQPMFIGSTNHFLPTPTTPTTQSVPRPPISLLPPYLGPTGPGYDSNTFFITSTNIPTGIGNNNNNNNNHNNNNNNNNNNNDINEQQSNQSENNFNNIHPIHNGNEFGQGGFEIQQSHNNNNNNNNNNNHHNGYPHGSHSQHNHHRSRNHHNVNQQGYGPFNGQGYDAPSNSGRYIGPSSYQVGLRTRIN